LQLLYLPSELDITKYTKRVYPTFDCNQTPDPVLPTITEVRDKNQKIMNLREKVVGKQTIRKQDGGMAENPTVYFKGAKSAYDPICKICRPKDYEEKRKEGRDSTGGKK
jgi:hypothetical protein